MFLVSSSADKLHLACIVLSKKPERGEDMQLQTNPKHCRTSQPVFAFFVIVLLCSKLPPPFNGVFINTNKRVVKIHQHESDSMNL